MWDAHSQPLSTDKWVYVFLNICSKIAWSWYYDSRSNMYYLFAPPFNDDDDLSFSPFSSNTTLFSLYIIDCEWYFLQIDWTLCDTASVLSLLPKKSINYNYNASLYTCGWVPRQHGTFAVTKYWLWKFFVHFKFVKRCIYPIRRATKSACCYASAKSTGTHIRINRNSNEWNFNFWRRWQTEMGNQLFALFICTQYALCRCCSS